MNHEKRFRFVWRLGKQLGTTIAQLDVDVLPDLSEDVRLRFQPGVQFCSILEVAKDNGTSHSFLVVKHGCGKKELSFSLQARELLEVSRSGCHSTRQRRGISSVEPRYYELQLSALN